MKQTQQYLKAQNSIVPLFEPESLAVVGSFKEGRPGAYRVIKNLLAFGFPGKVYPVNPLYDTVFDRKVYPSIREVPQSIDLVVVITSAQVVPEIIGHCVEKKVKAAIIVSDGFAERDEQGARLQQEVVSIARSSGLRLLGPNTIGVVNPYVGLITSQYGVLYEKIHTGSIALCAQTGLIGPSTMPFEDMHYGISKICDFGNKCDIDEIDLLEYLGNDPKTKVIAMHLEDIRDGRSFLRKVKEVVSKKPVLILKPGRTEESRKALASHTGSLAGEDRIYDSAFKQAGVIRVSTYKELFDLAKIFAYQPLPAGNRVAIITMTGGGGVMGVDVAVESGLVPAELSPETIERLAEISPWLASNPVDLGPAAVVVDNFFSHYEEIVETVLKDRNVDCAAIVFSGVPRVLDYQIFARLKTKISKPVAFWIYGPKLSLAEEFARNLENHGFPAYPECEPAIKALGAAFQYSSIKSRFSQAEEKP
jgi:acyl-CoA synthetase (NDP forming)